MKLAIEIWNKIRKLFQTIFCKHNNKKEIFICYQDRYVKEKCNNCDKIIYSDI